KIRPFSLLVSVSILLPLWTGKTLGHWSLPGVVQGEIPGQPPSLHLLLFPGELLGVSAVIPEDGEGLGMREKTWRNHFPEGCEPE
ncbi:hypothetical protein HGM15179_012998, partial [Zosterops borbonicus]